MRRTHTIILAKSGRKWLRTPRRDGKVLALMLVMMPVFCGVAGLVIDGGLLMLEGRHAQNIADAASTAAATQLRLGNNSAQAIAAAEAEVHSHNGMSSADVTVNIPPDSGPYLGNERYVEVLVRQSIDTHLMHVLSGQSTETVLARSVAGVEDATEAAAIVVLDPDPDQFALGPLPITLPLSLPSLVGGLEVLGVGNVKVHGAAVVNTRWGGVDEFGEPAGVSAGAPYGVSCMPLLPTTRLYCNDLRVAGGVDDADNYRQLAASGGTPLQANRLAMPDPYKGWPVPTVASDPTNVKVTDYGGKTIIGLPLFPTTLNPGVYDYITIVSGKVIFKPGIYIIRGKHPVTQHSLYLVAGQVQADGVMFYLTNSAGYSATTGSPDSSDGESTPAAPGVGTLIPSAIVNLGLLSSSFTPLNSPSSPFHGMMFYQRRHDRRPIVFVQESLIGGGTLKGTVYTKWGHVILAGLGTYDARFVTGTMRLIALLNMEIKPSNPFDAAEDVFLVE